MSVRLPPRASWLVLTFLACSAEKGRGDTQVGSVVPRAATQLKAAASTSSPSEDDATTRGVSPVDAAGAAAPPPTPSEPRGESLWPSREQLARGIPTPLPGARVYSKSRHLWIRSRPGGVSADWLGYLSLGDSVRLKDGDPVAARAAVGQGSICQEWYAIEPAGYVCVGKEATLDPDDPEIVELLKTRADHTSAWPYRYGESLGAPVTVDLPALARSEADGSTPKFFASNPFIRTLFTHIHPGSTVAYTDAFDIAGKPHLLTWDRALVRSDDVRPYPESRFHGIPLNGDVRLPVGFVRADEGAVVLRRTEAGTFEETGEVLPRLAWVELAEGSEGRGSELTLEMRDGRWLRGGNLGVARPARTPPPMLSKSNGRKTWIDIAIGAGTLVAYEGETPVYVTLVSPGRGGPPVPGRTTLETASTPTGMFTILGKFVTATMVSSTVKTFVHSEVQYPQNFSGPYSLHGAYWHDRWGTLKSAGCVNLSPVDSKRMFAWTDPPVPQGWHGIRTPFDAEPRTLVSIRR